MLSSPVTAFGLGDGGAHCRRRRAMRRATTYLLSHWARDRTRGRAARSRTRCAKMTSETAALYGLGDRGVLAPGFVGDVNVIDFERLQLRRPRSSHDLPGDAKRLIQHADGYVATIKGGQVTDGARRGHRPPLRLAPPGPASAVQPPAPRGRGGGPVR